MESKWIYAWNRIFQELGVLCFPSAAIQLLWYHQRQNILSFTNKGSVWRFFSFIYPIIRELVKQVNVLSNIRFRKDARSWNFGSRHPSIFLHFCSISNMSTKSKSTTELFSFFIRCKWFDDRKKLKLKISYSTVRTEYFSVYK